MAFTRAVPLLKVVVAFAFAGATLANEDSAQGDLEFYGLAPGQKIPENATFSSSTLFPDFALNSGQAPQLVNSNPLAFANIFKRADCSFTRTDGIYTCADSSNRCCPYANNPADGWCCQATEACGPGTAGTDCSYKISWSTSTYWETEYSTRYLTETRYTTDSTSWSTYVLTDFTFVTRSNLDTATEWRTATITRNAKARRSAQPLVPAAPSRSTPLPVITPHNVQEALNPEVTEAPKILRNRGLLFKRQAIRTDTSYFTVTRTTYIYSTIDSTTTIRRTATSMRYSTTTTTRTLAVGAKTTVTSTLTYTLEPGQTLPSLPGNYGGGDEDSDGGLSGGASHAKKGLGSGAKAGIGVGAAAGALALGGLAALGLKALKGAGAGAAAAGASSGAGASSSATPGAATANQAAGAPSAAHAPPQMTSMQPGHVGPTYGAEALKQPMHGVTPVTDGISQAGTMSPPPPTDPSVSGMSQISSAQQMPGYYNPGTEQGFHNAPTPAPSHEMSSTPAPFIIAAAIPNRQDQEAQHPPVPIPAPYHTGSPPPQSFHSASPPPMQPQYQYPSPGPHSPSEPGYAPHSMAQQGGYPQQQPLPNEMPVYSPQPNEMPVYSPQPQQGQQQVQPQPQYQYPGQAHYGGYGQSGQQ